MALKRQNEITKLKQFHHAEKWLSFLLTRDWTGELNFTLGKELHDLSHRFRVCVCVSEREREIERERHWESRRDKVYGKDNSNL